MSKSEADPLLAEEQLRDLPLRATAALGESGLIPAPPRQPVREAFPSDHTRAITVVISLGKPFVIGRGDAVESTRGMAGTIRQRRAREMLQEIAADGESHDAIAKRIGVSQPFVSGIIKGSRSCGEETLAALKEAYLVHEDYFSEPEIGPRSWRDFVGRSPFRPESRVEREDEAHPVVEAFIAEMRMDQTEADDLRRQVRAWDGRFVRDELLMLLPAIRMRAARLRAEAEGKPDPAPTSPPPVPEGRRRVPPGRRGR